MVVGSCGHSVAELDDLINVTYGDSCLDHDVGYVRCVAHASVCKACYEQILLHHFVINNEEDERRWMEYEANYPGDYQEVNFE